MKGLYCEYHSINGSICSADWNECDESFADGTEAITGDAVTAESGTSANISAGMTIGVTEDPGANADSNDTFTVGNISPSGMCVDVNE